MTFKICEAFVLTFFPYDYEQITSVLENNLRIFEFYFEIFTEP